MWLVGEVREDSWGPSTLSAVRRSTERCECERIEEARGPGESSIAPSSSAKQHCTKQQCKAAQCKAAVDQLRDQRGQGARYWPPFAPWVQ
jgi:hypothetical protein